MAGIFKILGHERALRFFNRSIQANKVSHAYLISGEEGVGKRLVAQDFSMKLFCQGKEKPCGRCPACLQILAGSHPDYFHVDAEGKNSLGIDKIRGIVDSMGIRPFQSRYKVYLIDEADRMTIAAQNAFLKTIEEPPDYGVVIFLAQNKEMLLETIRSRCVKVGLSPLGVPTIKQWLMARQVPEYMAGVCAAFCGGCPGRALTLSASPDFMEEYQRNVDFLKMVTGAAIQDILVFIGNIKSRPRGFESVLDFFRLWYRDVLYYALTGDTKRLGFGEEVRDIGRIGRSLSLIKINRILCSLEDAQAKLRSNVNGEMVMQLVCMELRT